MKLNWRKIFDWTIRDVRGPERFYSGPANSFRGYAVVVSYVHHGDQVFLFRYDDETMYTEYQGPLDAATTAFNDFSALMRRQQAKKQNKQKG